MRLTLAAQAGMFRLESLKIGGTDAMAVIIVTSGRKTPKLAALARSLAVGGIDASVISVSNTQTQLARTETDTATADVVIAVWSGDPTSQAHDVVTEIAARARDRGRLVRVRLDDRLPPLGFSQTPLFDLQRWRGTPKHQALTELTQACLALTSKPTTPKKHSWHKWLVGGSVGSIAMLGFSLTGIDLFNVQEQICAIPSPQPTISDVCGFIGLGDRPRRAERTAWEQRPQGSCEALRLHIQRFPDGKLVPQASALYAARIVAPTGRQVSEIKTLPLFVGAKAQGESKSDAFRRGEKAAERLCDLYSGETMSRLVSARPIADIWSCSDELCGFEGRAECTLEQAEIAEVCPSA